MESVYASSWIFGESYVLENLPVSPKCGINGKKINKKVIKTNYGSVIDFANAYVQSEEKHFVIN